MHVKIVTPSLRKVFNAYVILLVICTTHRRTSGKYESPGRYLAPSLKGESVKTNPSIYVRTNRRRSPQTVGSMELMVASCDQVLT